LFRSARGAPRAPRRIPRRCGRRPRSALAFAQRGPGDRFRSPCASARTSRLLRVGLSRPRRKLPRPGRHAAASGGRHAGLARLVSEPDGQPEGVDRRRTVFFVSDRTGITAEMLGNSLLSQFEMFDFQRRTIPFVDTPEKIADVVRTIDATRASDGKRPLVFSSIVDEAMSAQLGKAN